MKVSTNRKWVSPAQHNRLELMGGCGPTGPSSCINTCVQAVHGPTRPAGLRPMMLVGCRDMDFAMGLACISFPWIKIT